jgi:hypothetical protein
LPVEFYLPDFAAAHRTPLLDPRVAPRVWIGNAVKIKPALIEESHAEPPTSMGSM